MICKQCGSLVEDRALTCEVCGTYLGPIGMESRQSVRTPGASAIRQGRRAQSEHDRQRQPNTPVQQPHAVYGSFDVRTVDEAPQSYPPSYERITPDEFYGASRPGRQTSSLSGESGGPFIDKDFNDAGANHMNFYTGRPMRKRGFNWAVLLLCVVIAAVLAVGGYTVYMNTSDTGMSATARKNTLAASDEMFELAGSTGMALQADREALLETWGEAEPRIYWNVANEYMDNGDIDTAIRCFRIADVLEPENYDGLMELADAYELNNEDDKAEDLYIYLVEEVSTFRTEAYSALINLYQEQDRRSDAAEIMRIAYENTDNINFYLQRKEYIPQTPEINLSAGRYELTDTGLKATTYVDGEYVHLNQLELSSPQGYDIYYTLDADIKLPDDGIFYEHGVKLEPGSITIRAVCVSDDLTSDPLSVSYTFFYPTPPAPQCNLAPNTYTSKKTVSLRAGEINDDTMTRAEKANAEKYYTYYYTINGEMPTTNSPQYDGTPIALPVGRVTLKAICVNQYGNSSSALEVGYKFNVPPYLPETYSDTDQFENFVLNKTEMEKFKQFFGKPKETLSTKYLNLPNEAQHLVYDWGYAVFILNNNKWLLVRVEMTSKFTTDPRGVGVGSTEAEVLAAFRDYGQLENADGTRGLYYDYPKTGQVLLAEDGSHIIRYTCQNSQSNMLVLQYHIGPHGTVNKVCHFYQP